METLLLRKNIQELVRQGLTLKGEAYAYPKAYCFDLYLNEKKVGGGVVWVYTEKKEISWSIGPLGREIDVPEEMFSPDLRAQLPEEFR